MAAPIQQIFMMLSTAATGTINGLKFWFNGLPVPGLAPAGAVKFWYRGLPLRGLKNS